MNYSSSPSSVPSVLAPPATELFIIEGRHILVPKCILAFERWTGEPLSETFGGKPLVTVDGKPMFAELAIMTYYANDGWEARWVETYGKRTPIYLAEWKDDKYRNQIHAPFSEPSVDEMLAEIAALNGNSYSGCWDVVAYKNGAVLFAESKRTKKDRIRTTQTNWLAAALRYGLQPENFLVVQWDMAA